MPDNLPHRCPCAAELEHLREMLLDQGELLKRTMTDYAILRAVVDTEPASGPGATYTDPKVARITAARRRMTALGWHGVVA